MPRLHSRLFIRILSRNGDVYLLKLITLAVAFATGILVILFSINEYRYDSHYGHVFRLLARDTSKDYTGNRLSGLIPPHALQSISSELRERVIISRMKTLNAVLSIASGKTFFVQQIYAADRTLDKIFPFVVIDGNIDQFTESDGHAAMLSGSQATRYFGETSPLGQTIRLTTYGDTINVLVVAVFKDFPSNTHETYNFFINYDSSAISGLNFDPRESNAYARLSSAIPSSPSLPAFRDGTSEYLFQPIGEIYFGPRVIYEGARHGDLYSMVILICIVSLIFVLALCTFVNLSIITLPYRSKEIAVKKLAGTTQQQLLFQFAYESLTLTGVSLFLALLILLCTSRYISAAMGIDIVPLLMSTNLAFLGIIVLMVSAVVIAPVFMIIRFIGASPTRLLSTESITFPRFKRIITIVQFGVSLFLIVSSIVVRRQINYSLLKEPGRNHDQLVYIACPHNISDSAIHKMRAGWPNRNPHIIDAIAVSQLPGHVKSKDVASGVFVLQVNPDFQDFFQFTMNEGRWFKPNDSDSAFIMNQMALRNMCVADRDAVADGNAIGVIQDLGSMFQQPEQPIKIVLAQNSNYNWLCVRVLEVDIRRTVEWIEQRMAERGLHAKVFFFNPHFESWLAYQDQLNALSGILTLISAFLAGCAIYGLTVSLVRDKLKVIAVHHLFGARAIDVTRLLAVGLLRQMLIALVFCGPVTYVLLSELLRSFVYTTKFSWKDPVYPVGYCAAVIIGLCAYQAFSLYRRDFTTALKGN